LARGRQESNIRDLSEEIRSLIRGKEGAGKGKPGRNVPQKSLAKPNRPTKNKKTLMEQETHLRDLRG